MIHKKTILLLLLFSATLSIFSIGCKDNNDDITNEDPIVIDDDDPIIVTPPVCEDVITSVTKANNLFAFELFQELNATPSETDKNLFISPLSISLALGMTYNGASGVTADEMQETLNLNELTITESNEGVKCLMNVLEQTDQTDDQVQIDIANSIWSKQEYNVKAELIDIVENYFDGEIKPLDFADPAALDIIHGWISDNTNGKITEILDQIPANAVMYLINAIYFKGNWKYSFDETLTTDKTFFKEDGSTYMTPFMKQEGDFNYLSTTKFSAIDLPYGNDNLSMTAFLPKDGYKVNDIIEDLNEENWNTWLADLDSTNVQITFPKFKLEYKILLNDALKTLGMPRAFSSGAEFDNLFEEQLSLAISRVLHKTFIEVNEVGTEAAAVTVVEIVETSAQILPTFNANRPFVYVIRDKVEGSIVFIGKMMEPSVQ